MPDIDVRKEDKSQPTAPATTERRMGPLRLMRRLLNWDPFQAIAPSIPLAPMGFVPSFDVKESKEGYLFKADLPGLKEADLDITVTGNRLTVAGKREAEKEEKTDRYYTFECSYGEFSRSFTLPDGVDMNSVQADLKDGVLTISIRKAAEAQAKKIEVQTAGKKS